MKLSAPPPPPPPPGPSESGPTPEPNEGLPPKAEEPTTPATLTEPVPPAAAEPAVPAEQPAPKPATWPAWFAGADVALAVLVVGFAFLAASFAARNSDLWVHLGAGRMLTTGEYKLGSDPLSYTAADRPWVNHNWLFDLGAYLLYRGDGAALVVVKAVAVALAFGLLLAIRRPGQPLWPWAVVAAVAVLAAAPQLHLRPLVGSVLFLALTLFLVFRLPSPPGSWRLPVAIGITFWFWANIDAWFILGPLALGLLLVGELLRRHLAKGETARVEADPLGQLPDPATLGRALVVGIIACMLNPHHVRVWQLPIELTAKLAGLPGMEDDPRLLGLVMDPLRTMFWQNAGLAYNANGFAYAALLVAGLYASFLSGAVGRAFGPAAEIDPLPLPLVFLWLGFAAVSLLTWVAIPFLAVVTVPLVASRFNQFSGRLVLGPWADRRTRLLLTGSAAGRVVSIVAVVALCVAAWPGWVHAPGSCWWESQVGNPALARRVEWVVEPDPGLRRGAEWLAEARRTDRLPADTRGLLASFDLANYCAWFAPGEKVFANGRYAHHRPELQDFLRARRGLGLLPDKDGPPDPGDAEAVFERYRLRYAGVAVGIGETELTRAGVERAKLQMLAAWKDWTPWHLDGRTTIAGWRPTAGGTGTGFDRLRIDPAVLAFGPGVQRLPAGQVKPVPPPRTVADEFLRPVPLTPPGADEAADWLGYKRILVEQAALREQVVKLFQLNTPGVAVPPVGPALFQAFDTIQFRQRRSLAPVAPPDRSNLSIPILALRAARRAVAEAPDHPDGYFALARVLADPGLPLSEAERTVGVVTAYHQCLDRFPPPDQYRRGNYRASPTQVAALLAGQYLNRTRNGFGGEAVDLPVIRELVGDVIVVQGKNAGRVPYREVQAGRLPQGVQVANAPPSILPLDLARQLLLKAEGYARVEFAHDPDARQGWLKGLEDERKQLDPLFTQATEQFRAAAERQPRPKDRYNLALRAHLPGEALETVKGLKEGIGKEFGAEVPGTILQIIALELALGRLEDAAVDLADGKEFFDRLAAEPNANPHQIQAYRGVLRQLEFQKMVLEGDYAGAGAELEDIEGPGVGTDPLVAELVKAKIDPRKYTDFETVWPRMAELGVAWPLVSMLGAPVLGPDSPVGVVAAYWGGRVYFEHFQRLAAARQALAGKLQQDAQFFFRRGVLSLLEGDVPGARTRFEQANTRPVPPGWGLPPVRHVLAAQYLRLIDEADKRAAR